MKNSIIFKYVILAVIILVIIVAGIFTIDLINSSKRLSYSTDFSDGGNSFKKDSYLMSDNTNFSISDENSGTGKSLYIENIIGNDSRYIFKLNAKKNVYYKISCDIKTEGIGEENAGANISILDTTFSTSDIKGSNDWQHVEMYVTSVKKAGYSIALRLGGYGSLNTGKVWFSNFKIDEIKSLPLSVNQEDVHTMGIKAEIDQEALKTERQYNNMYTIMFLMLMPILIIILLSLYRSEGQAPYFKGLRALLILLGAGFIVRVITSPYAIGFEGDVYLFKIWGQQMSQDLPGFYEVLHQNGTIADYPPLYMYILGIMGSILKIFNVPFDAPTFKLLIKMPVISADVLSAYFIYKLCGNKMKQSWKLFLAGAYLFNPLILFNTIVWGQMDSVLAVFVFAAVYLASKKKYILSGILFAMSIMLKPQGFFAAPVLIYAVLKDRNWKKFLGCAIAVPSTMIMISLPYIIKGMSPFISTAQNVKDFMISIWMGLKFIPDLIANTASGYPYASVNGFNFWNLIGLNGKQDSFVMGTVDYWTIGLCLIVVTALISYYLFKKYKQFAYIKYVAIITLFIEVVFTTFLFIKAGKIAVTYYLLGMSALALVVIAGGVLFFKLPKDSKSKFFLISLFITSGIFTFVIRMHERYLFPCIILSLVVAIYDNSRFMMLINGLISTTIYFNSLAILGKYNSGQDMYVDNFWISFLNIVAFILILIYTIMSIKGKPKRPLIGPDDYNYEPKNIAADIIEDTIVQDTMEELV